MEIASILSIISILISVLTGIFSGYTFWKYDKKIKEQDAKINEYQLRALEKQEQEAQKAIVCANPYCHKNSMTKVKIYNKGKAIAYNVCFVSDDNVTLQINDLDKLIPYKKLNPQESFELIIHCFQNVPVCQIKLTWEDDSGKQEYTQALQLT